jgi:hypothetical protein
MEGGSEVLAAPLPRMQERRRLAWRAGGCLLVVPSEHLTRGFRDARIDTDGGVCAAAQLALGLDDERAPEFGS